MQAGNVGINIRLNECKLEEGGARQGVDAKHSFSPHCGGFGVADLHQTVI